MKYSYLEVAMLTSKAKWWYTSGSLEFNYAVSLSTIYYSTALTTLNMNNERFLIVIVVVRGLGHDWLLTEQRSEKLTNRA
jgi:hypothetical protein